MFKKTVTTTAVLSSIFLGLMVLAGPALAQQSLKDAIKTKLEEQKAKIEEKVKENKMEVQQKVQEVKKKLEAKQAERIMAMSKKMLARFDLAVKRLDNLAGRVSSRLDAIAKTGKDVAKNRKALDEAKAKVDIVRTKLADAKASFDALINSETPKADFETAKAKLNDVKDAIKTAQSALVDVVSSIKGGKPSTSSTENK